MIALNSKIAKVIFAVITSLTISIIWKNVWHVTVWLDIPSRTVLSSFVRDLLMAISVIVISQYCNKAKEDMLFSWA